MQKSGTGTPVINLNIKAFGYSTKLNRLKEKTQSSFNSNLRSVNSLNSHWPLINVILYRFFCLFFFFSFPFSNRNNYSETRNIWKFFIFVRYVDFEVCFKSRFNNVNILITFFSFVRKFPLMFDLKFKINLSKYPSIRYPSFIEIRSYQKFPWNIN